MNKNKNKGYFAGKKSKTRMNQDLEQVDDENGDSPPNNNEMAFEDDNQNEDDADNVYNPRANATENPKDRASPTMSSNTYKIEMRD